MCFLIVAKITTHQNNKKKKEKKSESDYKLSPAHLLRKGGKREAKQARHSHQQEHFKPQS